jgi:amino acid transporter
VSTPAQRRLTLLDCVGIGINGIVGSGIFLLPVRVYAQAGGLSWLAWLLVGLVCLLVALCFGEVASLTTRSGGPQAYARDAFGNATGFAVGWMAFASGLLGYAAVARGLGQNLSYLFPALAIERWQVLLAWLIVSGLGLLNWVGVRPGATASNLFSAAKLLPLFLFVGLGLFAVDPGRLSAPPPSGAGPLRALQLAGAAGLFACTGFEYVPVPAGETRNPQRAVPLALLGSLLGATLLYALVQLVLTGTHPDLLHAKEPLAEAATRFAGGRVGALITLGAVVSSFGFCAGSALVCPRYLAALAEDGLLPKTLAEVHPRFGTPSLAIGLVALSGCLLATLLDFDRLSDISIVALFAQYVPTCLSVIALRRKLPAARRLYRLPGGPVIPLLATAGCLLLLSGMRLDDAVLSGAVLAAGLLLHWWRQRGLSADGVQP